MSAPRFPGEHTPGPPAPAPSVAPDRPQTGAPGASSSLSAKRLAGRILALCSGAGGVPKYPLEAAEIGPLGIVGDRHRYVLHGGESRALCLLSIEAVRSLERDGVRTRGPGTFGENVLTEGLDFSLLRPGDHLALGGPETPLLIELHDVREPCRTLLKIDRRFPDLMLGRSGFMARVLRGGRLQPGASIWKV